MSEVTPDTYTRKDLMQKFQCSYASACRIWNKIIAPLTDEEKKKFKTRLPIQHYDKYIGK